MSRAPIQIPRGDGAVIEHLYPVGFDATGHTVTARITANKYAADSTAVSPTGLTVIGTLTGNATVGFVAKFVIPASETAAKSERWIRAKTYPPAGADPLTLFSRPLHVVLEEISATATVTSSSSGGASAALIAHQIDHLVHWYESATAPVSPTLGFLWLDTSTTPSTPKRWTGTAWESLNGVGTYVPLPTAAAPAILSTPGPLIPSATGQQAAFRESVRLPYTSMLTSTNKTGKVVNLIGVGLLANGTMPYANGWLSLGDDSLDYIHCHAQLDLGGSDVIDCQRVGNTEGLYSPKFGQFLDSTVAGYNALTASLDSMIPGGVGKNTAIARLVWNSGQAEDATYVKVQNARFQVVATTGVTKPIQQFASNGTTERLATDTGGRITITTPDDTQNHIQTLRTGSVAFFVAPDGTYLGVNEFSGAGLSRIGGLGPAAQAALLLGDGFTSIYREAQKVFKCHAASVFKTGMNVTGSRPAAATVGAGAQFYDTTLALPIWSDGTNWKNAAGVTV